MIIPLAPHSISTQYSVSPSAIRQLTQVELDDKEYLVLPRLDPRICLLIKKGVTTPYSTVCIERFIGTDELNVFLSTLTPLSKPAVKIVELFVNDFMALNDADIIAVPAHRLLSMDLWSELDIDEWHHLIVPLSLLPSRPLEGFYAIKTSEVKQEIRDLHFDAFQLARSEAIEESKLAAQGFDYATTQIRAYGSVSFFRTSSDCPTKTLRILVPSVTLPRTIDSAAWPLLLSEGELFTRHPLSVEFTPDDTMGVLVSRHNAVEQIDLSGARYVWTAGLTTWKKLVAQGVWVNGTCDSLGEDELRNALAFLHPVNWIKLSHDEPTSSSKLPCLATYVLKKLSSIPDMKGKTHFYWRSGSVFLEVLGAHPEIAQGFHWSGPGNTRNTLLEYIPAERCSVALTHTDWKNLVVYEYETATENTLHAAH